MNACLAADFMAFLAFTMSIRRQLLGLAIGLGASCAMAGVATDLAGPTPAPRPSPPDLEIGYQPIATTGRLTADPGDGPERFGEHRWPLIVRALLWRRDLARHAAPARAEEFIPRLKIVFADEGIPPELAWVAEVESSFNPDAGSPAGARGLFQFMPETAEQFGLEVSQPDERTIPEKCARAAARYLGQLHRQFGNWALALAAYNAGAGRVERLLRRHQALTFEEIAAYLPDETQLYVPKVMATLAVRENIQLSSLPAPAAAAL